MADVQLAIQPLEHYRAACQAIRDRLGTTSDLIRSGDMAALIRSIVTGNCAAVTASGSSIAELRLDADTIAAIDSASASGPCAAVMEFNDSYSSNYSAVVGLLECDSDTSALFSGHSVVQGQVRATPGATPSLYVAAISTDGAGVSIVDDQGQDVEPGSTNIRSAPVKLTVYLPTGGSGSGGVISEWTGTQAEYDAMESHDSGTYYAIVEAT